jgi:hypothetical protein
MKYFLLLALMVTPAFAQSSVQKFNSSDATCQHSKGVIQNCSFSFDGKVGVKAKFTFVSSGNILNESFSNCTVETAEISCKSGSWKNNKGESGTSLPLRIMLDAKGKPLSARFG